MSRPMIGKPSTSPSQNRPPKRKNENRFLTSPQLSLVVGSVPGNHPTKLRAVLLRVLERIDNARNRPEKGHAYPDEPAALLQRSADRLQYMLRASSRRG